MVNTLHVLSCLFMQNPTNDPLIIPLFTKTKPLDLARKAKQVIWLSLTFSFILSRR